MTCCYILFSAKINRYYTGVSHDNLQERIMKHNLHSYGKHCYTAQADDWELFHFIECPSFSAAVRMERHIKKMKSTTYIQNLKKYPEMEKKLREKTE